MRSFLKNSWAVLKETGKGFVEHKITKISGSLAYFTVFSMAPLLVVIISFCGFFLEKEAVEGQIYAVLKNFVGQDTAVQLQELVKNAAVENSGIAAVIGLVTLLIGATTVFAEIQDSVNYIWGLKPKPKKSWLKYLQNRFLSFSVIVGLGFLLLVSLFVTGLIEGLNQSLQRHFPAVTVVVFYVVNLILTLGISMLIFAVIFKVLPDAVIRWKDVFVGALITSGLFLIGKFAISVYISQTKIGTTYGAAGSLAILLVWIYYSSIILYIGAEFTRAYAIKFGREIRPSHYAVTLKEIEVETNNEPVKEL
ncbi:MAG: YihY/virulence factor BrkB family protein [Chitinophagaceae bacterium]|nr:MAG: YihY/virulence factor BrkB family protein [Chitinophagaceae bacterium]